MPEKDGKYHEKEPETVSRSGNQPVKYAFEPIGVVHSCFKEKFGVPRQPGLVTEAVARLEIHAPFGDREAFRGLEQFTHLWVIFVFHEAAGRGWRPAVRPPRLGGNARMGVFASRSPFRPNPVGMSAVKIEAIVPEMDSVSIHVRGGDFLDGTPVLDIKPYIAWSDSPENAGGGFAESRPAPALSVVFSKLAAAQCERKEREGFANLSLLIRQTIEQDPRPAYHGKKTGERVYGMRLLDFDVKWSVKGRTATVLSLDDPG